MTRRWLIGGLISVLVSVGTRAETPLRTPAAVISLVEHDSGRIYAIAYSPDGKTLAVGGTGRNLHLIDVESRRVVRSFPAHPDAVWSVAWSKDSRQLYSGGRADPILRVWEAATGAELTSFVGHRGGITVVRVFDAGRKLLSAGGSWDPSLRVWSVADRRLLRSMAGHTDLIDAMDVTENGRWVLTGSRDGTLRLWDGQRGHEIWNHRVETQGGHGGYLSVAFSPDGRLFAAGLEDGGLIVRETMTCRRCLPAKERGGETRALAFAPDGRWLAFADSTRRIHLWDVRTGQIGAVFQGHRGDVFAVAFSPEGRQLASAGADALVCLWEVPRSKEDRRILSDEERQQAIDRLFAENPGTARHGINDLSNDLGPASEAIAARIPPRAALSPSIIQQAIERLASARFAEREQAAEELLRRGDAAEIQLRQAWAAAAEAEQRRRLDRILNQLSRKAPSPESLGQRRAIAVLEARADTVAIETLRTWATADRSWLSIEAREALERLTSSQRNSVKP